MGQEFIIKSQSLEDKVNQLLPSQGGFQAGVDLSASTTIIPIVDLTESAENSGLREDLQKSYSFTSSNYFNVTNATNTTIISTTGYHRLLGQFIQFANNSQEFNLFDGTSSKILFDTTLGVSSVAGAFYIPYDFIIFLAAGQSLRCTSTNAAVVTGVHRQVATITGELVDPL